MINNIVSESKESINKAASYLKDNKLVAIKTETVYGIACDPSSIKSIKKLYDLKKRPVYNPLIIHVDSINTAKKIAFINSITEKIINAFWPGPLTIILPKKRNKLIHDFALSGLETIAIRFPKSETIQRLLFEFQKPIAAPSANESGYVSATDAKHVIDSFGKKIDLIIDSGRTDYGLESTILDTTTNPYKIRRLGIIDYKRIKKKTGVHIESSILTNKIIKPNSPGQMEKHYATRTPLYRNINKPKINDAFLNFGNDLTNHEPTLNLSKASNLDEAAYNLFDFLRKLDKLNKKRIVVAPIPNIGIGKTINERLLRAST